MDVEVLLPQRGMGMKEATIVHWHVKEGDAVQEGDNLVDIESSKAADEILAPSSGIVSRINFDEDEEVEVGEILAVITPFEAGESPSPERGVVEAKTDNPPEQEPVETEPAVSHLRRVTAERMHFSLQSSAQLTLQTSVDILETVKRRELLKAEAGITYTDILIRITAGALLKHPAFCMSWEDDRLIRRSAINIGVAIDTADGLVVPVIKHADQKSLIEIHAKVAELVDKANQGKLNTDDLSGGTFTVTNLGKSCVDYFTPILNPPEAGILGVGRISDHVVPDGDEIRIRPQLGLSLTFDHRVVDGKPAAVFLTDICAALEAADF